MSKNGPYVDSVLKGLRHVSASIRQAREGYFVWMWWTLPLTMLITK